MIYLGKSQSKIITTRGINVTDADGTQNISLHNFNIEIIKISIWIAATTITSVLADKIYEIFKIRKISPLNLASLFQFYFPKPGSNFIESIKQISQTKTKNQNRLSPQPRTQKLNPKGELTFYLDVQIPLLLETNQ